LARTTGRPSGSPTNYKSSPGSFLRLPQYGKALLSYFLFPSIWIIHAETHSSAGGAISYRKNPTLIMALVIAMQYDSSAAGPEHHDNVVLENDRQA
jgi:hypothetical protein